LFVGERGCGKSTLARLFQSLLPAETPFIELPLNATEEAVLGGIDLEKTIRSGDRYYQPSLLDRAAGGFLYVDDVNLLAGEILALVLQSQESVSLRSNGSANGIGAGFQLIASMTAESPLSPHVLDRFGMAVPWRHVDDPTLRAQIILAAGNHHPHFPDPRDLELRESVLMARQRIEVVGIPEKIEGLIAEQCGQALISGHRGDIYLYYAARANAALSGKAMVSEEDLNAVLPLVLEHRRRLPPPDNAEQQRQHKRHENQKQENERPHDDAKGGARQDAPSTIDSEPQDGDRDAATSKALVALPKEQVFEIGDTFTVRRFQFRRDRVKRGSSGRKVKTLSHDKRGRYVKSVERGFENDIAIDATIRAAAPWQKLRGAGEILSIRPEDILFKQREKRIGHLTIFVVDGSGSMGAQNRMTATKGAIQSLLLDSYQKRDKIAMIVFRKDQAELVLPPTSSVVWASRLLREIPVGGKTPLSAGLWRAYNLIQRIRLKAPETRFLVTLITDGKANQSMTAMSPAEEVRRMAMSLRELAYAEFIVVDTENTSSFVRTGSARKVAADLGAQYWATDNLKAESLASLIQNKTHA